MKQYSSVGSSHIDQPREGKPSMTISDREIKHKVLESKEFAYSAGEQLRDNMTNEQAALIAYYLFNECPGVDSIHRKIDIGRLTIEHFGILLKKVLDSEIEAYKDKHGISYDPEEE
jgi:hypothetical protein